jgi:putative ABC transport system permease protein
MLRDLRFAARMWARSPLHATVVVIALGLGIGLPGLMFSVVHGLFLRGLPFEESDRLVQLDSSNLSAGVERMPLGVADYLYLRSQQSSLEDLAAWAGVGVVVGGAGEPAERYNGANISANLFSLLRVRPSLGRGFAAGDSPGGEPAVLISDEVWRRRYGGDRGLVGRQIRINGEMRTVIGVMPPGFHFPLSQDFWLPLVPDPLAEERGVRIPLQGVGRLAEGASLRKAQTEMASLGDRLAREHPETHRGVGFVVRPYIEAYSDPQMRSYLQTMLGAVLGVLLIACANMSNLQASRMAQRTEEIAVRQALGAGRLLLLRQFLIESFLLVACGGAVGLLLTVWGSRVVQQTLQPILRSFWIDIRVDLPVVLFLLGLAGGATVVGGVVPAFRIASSGIVARLRGQGAAPRADLLARGLVVAQIALACGLLVPTALLIQSLANVRNLDYGMATDDLLVAVVSLPSDTYSEPQAALRFFDELQRRVAARPGTRGVAVSSILPHQRPPFVEAGLEGEPVHGSDGERSAGWVTVSPEFFELTSALPLEGRIFLPSDDASATPVAVVTRSFAERWSRTRSPVGLRLFVRQGNTDAVALTIVGVVPDLYKAELPQRGRGFLPVITRNEAPFGGETIFVPFAQNPLRSPAFLVQTEGNANQLVAGVRAEVAAIDSDVLTLSAQSLEDLLAEALWDYRFFGRAFAVFGGAAFALALIGLYGVMSLAVRRRTREIGIRIALGARRVDVLRRVLAEGLSQLGMGVLIGSGLAVALSRAMTSLFFGVAPWDYRLWLGVLLVFVVAGVASCLVPSLRATAIDPLIVMRSDGKSE